MNFLASECSADCESGWTLYLEQSLLSNPNSKHGNKTSFVDAESAGLCGKGKNTREESEEEEEEEDEEEEEEEEEDLSMVSDASSGPPHFHEDESYFNYDNGHFYPSLKGTALLNNGANYRQKKKEHSRQPRHRQDQELPPFLDDTASSPAFNFSKVCSETYRFIPVLTTYMMPIRELSHFTFCNIPSLFLQLTLFCWVFFLLKIYSRIILLSPTVTKIQWRVSSIIHKVFQQLIFRYLAKFTSLSVVCMPF